MSPWGKKKNVVHEKYLGRGFIYMNSTIDNIGPQKMNPNLIAMTFT